MFVPTNNTMTRRISTEIYYPNDTSVPQRNRKKNQYYRVQATPNGIIAQKKKLLLRRSRESINRGTCIRSVASPSCNRALLSKKFIFSVALIIPIALHSTLQPVRRRLTPKDQEKRARNAKGGWSCSTTPLRIESRDRETSPRHGPIPKMSPIGEDGCIHDKLVDYIKSLRERAHISAREFATANPPKSLIVHRDDIKEKIASALNDKCQGTRNAYCENRDCQGCKLAYGIKYEEEVMTQESEERLSKYKEYPRDVAIAMIWCDEKIVKYNKKWAVIKSRAVFGEKNFNEICRILKIDNNQKEMIFAEWLEGYLSEKYKCFSKTEVPIVVDAAEMELCNHDEQLLGELKNMMNHEKLKLKFGPQLTLLKTNETKLKTFINAGLKYMKQLVDQHNSLIKDYGIHVIDTPTITMARPKQWPEKSYPGGKKPKKPSQPEEVTKVMWKTMEKFVALAEDEDHCNTPEKDIKDFDGEHNNYWKEVQTELEGLLKTIEVADESHISHTGACPCAGNVTDIRKQYQNTLCPYPKEGKFMMWNARLGLGRRLSGGFLGPLKKLYRIREKTRDKMKKGDVFGQTHMGIAMDVVRATIVTPCQNSIYNALKLTIKKLDELWKKADSELTEEQKIALNFDEHKNKPHVYIKDRFMNKWYANNGYFDILISVMLPSGKWVEVQYNCMETIKHKELTHKIYEVVRLTDIAAKAKEYCALYEKMGSGPILNEGTYFAFCNMIKNKRKEELKHLRKTKGVSKNILVWLYDEIDDSETDDDSIAPDTMRDPFFKGVLDMSDPWWSDWSSSDSE